MGRIVVTEFVSLDGVMEDPGGSENFGQGGWSFKVSRGDEGDKFKLDETFASDALLLGRVTYEGFAEAWPSREGEFADKFNNMPKYVVSSTLDEPEWQNSTVLKGDVVEEVGKLKQEQDGYQFCQKQNAECDRRLSFVYGMKFVDRRTEFYNAQHRKLHINHLTEPPNIGARAGKTGANPINPIGCSTSS